jgi:hypothetical protein
MAAQGSCVWNICRLENGMLKHNVEDDFDPDGMGVALNLSMNYEVAIAHCARICCVIAVWQSSHGKSGWSSMYDLVR